MFNTVNEYCLNRIVRLSEAREVVASEDICDASGMKLWAKGKRVSAELQQRLLQRKLARPLETALTVESAISLREVVAGCLEQLESHPLAKCFAGSQTALAMLRSLQREQLSPSVRLLLTAMHEHNPDDYRNHLTTILLTVGMASRLKASDSETMTLMLAGLLHDFGLIYINPELVERPYYRLEPKEWKYVAAHPVIGQLLIKELTTLPPIIGQCIALHHERLDGSGYPNHVDRDRMHRLGAWLAVADSVSGIMGRNGKEAAARISLALRVIPEEYDRSAVAAVLQSIRGYDTYVGSDDRSCFDRAEYEMDRIQRVLQMIQELARRNPDATLQGICNALRTALGNIEKSLRATGVLDARTQLEGMLDDPELLSEMNQIAYEVGWRMRNMARNLYLRAEAHAGGVLLEEFKEIIDLLDGISGVPSSACVEQKQARDDDDPDVGGLVPAFA